MPVLANRHGSCFLPHVSDHLKNKVEQTMRKILIVAAIVGLTSTGTARAQTDLSAYADANGYLDVQKLTCAQLAGTWQQDADMLTTWYSGWYNGLAHKHMLNISLTSTC